MEQFVNELEMELNEALQSIQPGEDPLSREKQCVQLVKAALFKLRDRLKDYHFPTVADEIHYFKDLEPKMYSRLFFYHSVYYIEMERLQSTQEQLESYLLDKLLSFEQFHYQHKDFYSYYYHQHTYLDEKLFIKKAWKDIVVDDVMLLMEPDPCIGSYWAATVLAHHELRNYIERQFQIIRSPHPENSDNEQEMPMLEWTDSLTNLVELINGLHLVGSFNNGKAEIKQISKWFEAHLNIDLGHFYITFQEIARRKKSRTKFMDQMRERLIQKLEDMDE